MPKSLPSAQYQALKRRAAICPKSPAQRENATKALLQLLELPEWRNATIYLKKKKVEGGEEQYLSKSRPWHDFFTNKGHRQSEAALKFMRDTFAEPLKADSVVGPAAKELVDVLVDDRKLIKVGRESYPVAGYYGGEADNGPLLRHRLRVLVGGFTNRDTMNNAEKDVAVDQTGGEVDATGVVKKEAPASQQPGVGKPVAPKTQPTGPAKVPDTKVSLYGRYPDPVYCGPAPKNGEPRFSDTTTRDRAALAVYRYLSGKPPVPPGLPRVTTYGNGDSYFEVVPENAAIDPEDAKAGQREFAQFFHDLCQAYVDDPDASDGIHRLAAGGMNIAAKNLKSGQDLENNPAMVEIFARLARIEPQETPRRKGVAAQAPSPVVAMVDANDRRNVHTNPSTPAAMLKSLLNQPGTAGYVLCTSVDKGGAVYVEAIPSADNPLTGAQAPADKRTCVLLANVARDYLTHPDENVQKEAKKLRKLALRSYRENRAIRNGPALHTMLAALTPPPQPKAPTIKPVAQTAPAPKRVPAPTRWVIAGSYTSEGPRKLRPQPAALTQLANSLRQAPTNWRLEVGTDVPGGQVSVRARPPASPQAPFDKATNEATYRFFQDLADHYIDKYRNSRKESDKGPAFLAVRLRQIADGAARQQINTPIANGQELQDLLLQLAAAG
jgi:hypothetical protein